MKINNQYILTSNDLYAQKSHFSDNFRGPSLNKMGILGCEGYEYEEFPDEVVEAPSSEHFFTRRLKILGRPDGFFLYGKLGVEFISFLELLYPNTKITLQLIRARPKSSAISDNPSVSFGIVDCALYTRRIALKVDFHKKRTNILAKTPVQFNYLETLAKTFILPATQNRFIQENIFNNAPARRIALEVIINFAITGLCILFGINSLIRDQLEYSEVANQS